MADQHHPPVTAVAFGRLDQRPRDLLLVLPLGEPAHRDPVYLGPSVYLGDVCVADRAERRRRRNRKPLYMPVRKLTHPAHRLRASAHRPSRKIRSTDRQVKHHMNTPVELHSRHQTGSSPLSEGAQFGVRFLGAPAFSYVEGGAGVDVGRRTSRTPFPCSITARLVG